MSTFEEKLEMEKIHKSFVDKLLRKHIKGLRGNPIFTGFNGKRDLLDRTSIRNEIYDKELGGDVVCNIDVDTKKDFIEQLQCHSKELVQVKASSYENFKEFGAYRKSFVICNMDEFRNEFISKVITGYNDSEKHGNLNPYVMLNFKLLFRALTEDARFIIYPKCDARNIDKNNNHRGEWICDKKNKPWLWIPYRILHYIDWKYGHKLIISKNVPKSWE